MELLSKEVKTNSSAYHQLKRQDDVGLYEQRINGRLTAYEVIIIHIMKARELFGKKYPKKEVYPKSSQWGEYRWTFSKIEKAEQKFKETVKVRAENRQNVVPV